MQYTHWERAGTAGGIEYFDIVDCRNELVLFCLCELRRLIVVGE
jgi:hypothetical protein